MEDVLEFLRGFWHGFSTFYESVPEVVLKGLQFFVGWLVDMAAALFGWLPDHVPLVLPPASSVVQLLGVFGTFGRYVDWALVLPIFGLILAYKLTILFYGAYRAVLGLVPFLK